MRTAVRMIAALVLILPGAAATQQGPAAAPAYQRLGTARLRR
jgi:hypothetical protein